MKSLEAFREIEPGSNGSDRMSRAIGWSSLGIGTAQLAAPSAIAGAIGLLPGTRVAAATRVMGLANLAIGTGIIMRPQLGSRMWARFAGDALGLGLLVWALRGERASGRRLAGALAASAGLLAIDALAARRLKRAHQRRAPLVFAVTINKPPSEVHAFFRKLENLPLFMQHLESVDEQADGRSRWVARLPFGRTIEWDAEITDDRPGERIAWQTVEGSTFAHRGEITFSSAPGGDRTEVRVAMELGLPGVAPSAALANLLTRPQIKGDLRRLKQVMETGEVLLSDASAVKGKHPAQPSERAVRRARAESSRIAKLRDREVTP